MLVEFLLSIRSYGLALCVFIKLVLVLSVSCYMFMGCLAKFFWGLVFFASSIVLSVSFPFVFWRAYVLLVIVGYDSLSPFFLHRCLLFPLWCIKTGRLLRFFGAYTTPCNSERRIGKERTIAITQLQQKNGQKYKPNHFHTQIFCIRPIYLCQLTKELPCLKKQVSLTVY